jgi:succinoglycan biosynthesis protein ExoA
MTNELSRLLVVIPCLNEELYLENLVKTLIDAHTHASMRIVIADGGSKDGTVQIAESLAQKYPHVIYMHNPKKLQAAAINRAVMNYGQEVNFLIRIDAHADYPKDYCQKLLDEALETKADSVVVAMETVGKKTFQKVVAATQNSILGNGGSAHRLKNSNGQWVDHGHHALMRIDAFKAVGGYDESFSHNEDAELDYRLTRAGFKIWLTNKTSLIYYPRPSLIALFRQYVGYGSGRARTIIKHRMIPKIRQMLPACVVPAFLLSLTTPFFIYACLPLLIWIKICLGYGLVLAYRRNDRSLALIGPAALLMHAGWSFGFWRAILRKRQ